MSPELIDPQRFGLDNSCPTKPSDCYALGMVIYETISGRLPFHKDRDITVFVKVLSGQRPVRGVLFTDSLWVMLERCWETQPNARPSIEDVLRCLELEAAIETPPRGLDAEIHDDYYDDDWSSVNDTSGQFSHFIPYAKFCGPCSYVSTETLLPTEGDSATY